MKTPADLIRWVAESDPAFYTVSAIYCRFCGKTMHIWEYPESGPHGGTRQKKEHFDDCWWLWCRERVEEQDA
jgi:hypothetical protein